MNNPNPYGAMGGNPQFGYGYRPQPNPSYGSRPSTWMLLVSGGATALALLMFTASFLGWTELRFNYDEGIMRLNVNGWGRVVVTGAPEVLTLLIRSSAVPGSAYQPMSQPCRY